MIPILIKNTPPSSNTLFFVLVSVNFLNFLDRSIIPGSADEFLVFISQSLNTDRPDIYLGFLQSGFIVGFSFASIIVSHQVHYRGPFYLIATGLTVWMISTILSALGYHMNNFSLLFFGRMLSGIGEASFVCIVPPWIAKHAPPGQKGRWLSIFYTALPVGTAFGYSYAAIIANILGCQYAFLIESIMMLPLAVYSYQIASYYPSPSSIDSIRLNHSDIHEKHILKRETSIPYITTDTATNATHGMTIFFLKSESNDLQYEHTETPSMLSELSIVVNSPIYVLITAGTILHLIFPIMIYYEYSAFIVVD